MTESNCCRFICNLSNRWLYAVGVLIILVLFGAALYLQYVLHQEPCPLCMVQRLVFIGLLVVFSVAALQNPKRIGSKIYAGVISLIAIAGMAVAGRHIWIQNLPKDQVPACGPGLDYMLETFPLADVWKELMHGSGECAAKGWTFVGLTIPELSMLWYVVLAALAMMIAWRSRNM